MKRALFPPHYLQRAARRVRHRRKKHLSLGVKETDPGHSRLVVRVDSIGLLTSSQKLCRSETPWKLIVSTLTLMVSLRL